MVAFRLWHFLCTHKSHEPTPTCRIQNASAQVDGGAGPQSESRFLLYPSLSGIIAFCWAASRGTLVKMLMSKVQSIVVDWLVGIWHSAIAQPQRAQDGTRPMADDAPRDPVSCGQAQTTSPKKVSWSYLRGVSLALSELCQDDHYGGDRIPLSAILDLMRQHQSAFIPLGPHVARDVPRRLIQLANDGVVFFDPFKEYVIVPEATRQRYALRRRELLAKGVDPANLSVFGAAFTRGLRPSERVTSAAVASYKGQFLRTEGRMGNNRAGALTRKESLISIADAICPAREIDSEVPSEDNNTRADAVRRGHSIVTDVARIISGRRSPDGTQEGTAAHHGSECVADSRYCPK